jgi:hypothetical protein
MATAKKTPAKKVAAKAPAKKAPVKAVKRPVEPSKREERTFAMPQEVKEWIERASSTMKHQATQIADLKAEVAQLKSYKKFAANKIQGMSYE